MSTEDTYPVVAVEIDRLEVGSSWDFLNSLYLSNFLFYNGVQIHFSDNRDSEEESKGRVWTDLS